MKNMEDTLSFVLKSHVEKGSKMNMLANDTIGKVFRSSPSPDKRSNAKNPSEIPTVIIIDDTTTWFFVCIWLSFSQLESASFVHRHRVFSKLLVCCSLRYRLSYHFWYISFTSWLVSPMENQQPHIYVCILVLLII